MKNIPKDIKNEDVSDRVDLRDKLIFTIDGEDTKNALYEDYSSCLYIDSPDNKESGAYINYRDYRAQNLSDYKTITITKPNSNVRIQAISETSMTVSSIKAYKLKDENTNYIDFFGESVRGEFDEWQQCYLASADSVFIPSGYYQLTCDSVTGPEDLRLSINFHNEFYFFQKSLKFIIASVKICNCVYHTILR